MELRCSSRDSSPAFGSEVACFNLADNFRLDVLSHCANALKRAIELWWHYLSLCARISNTCDVFLLARALLRIAIGRGFKKMKTRHTVFAWVSGDSHANSHDKLLPTVRNHANNIAGIPMLILASHCQLCQILLILVSPSPSESM